MVLKAINRDKYFLSVVIISLMVTVLIHPPESASLLDRSGSYSFFPGVKFMDAINEILFTFVSLFILFAISTRLLHFNQAPIRITVAKILLSFILTWILSNLLGQVFVFLHRTPDVPAIDAMVHRYLHLLRDLIMACLATNSCCIIYLARRQRLVLIENEQLQAENIRNQYEVLKNQLNPHMLFNSLNTLCSLARENQDKAQDYTQELSWVLRYALQSNKSQSVSLRGEMEFVFAYIFLLKVRFENNLQSDIRIAKSSKNCRLPPMAVQVLIENAVKYNKISGRKPLTIHTVTNSEGYLSVSNSTQPKQTAASSTGVGPVNPAKRYRLSLKQDMQIIEDKELSIRISLIDETQ